MEGVMDTYRNMPTCDGGVLAPVVLAPRPPGISRHISIVVEGMDARLTTIMIINLARIKSIIVTYMAQGFHQSVVEKRGQTKYVTGMRIAQLSPEIPQKDPEGQEKDLMVEKDKKHQMEEEEEEEDGILKMARTTVGEGMTGCRDPRNTRQAEPWMGKRITSGASVRRWVVLGPLCSVPRYGDWAI